MANKKSRLENIYDIKRFASEQGFYLRYPYDAILDETDYLLINITKYTPPGGVKRSRIENVPDEYKSLDNKGREITVKTTS